VENTIENKEITEIGEVKHQRRKRYSGTHPRKFSEKYKELNPEKYADDVAHIISRGATPAGMHISIMVEEILEFLDMPKVVFFASVKHEYKNGELVLDKFGADKVEFFISANRGADAQPIGKIASGGELARIMLALKCVLADKDGTLTVVFDEIDAGVSGKTARKIGIKMLSLSRNMQIFCVTHSAQIASLADNHYLIKKTDDGESTETSVALLSDEGRVSELSRILGGIDITASQREAAMDMLKEKDVYLQN
jgi:DNA repair protein RecN (Recombination protein N)